MANGNGYSAGNLEFVLQTFGKDTISTLDAVISRLTTMTSLLGSTSSITKAIGTTAGRRSSGGASFNPKDTNKQLKVSSIRLSNILNKVYFIRNYTKQMFRTLTGIIKNAVEYTETLNLWQVAMRGNTEEAEEFIKTMNKGYGIATQTLMQYQAIFKNMLSSLGGLTSDTSYALSEYLTQMALDYASLYNVSIERAMTTFQSVLSGQVRPIRSIAGYDITETTIYQLYQQLGGTKTMRQLSQTEKRLLRIYAVFQQMESSGAIGDLNKTLESTANQWRIFTEATKELGTWLGIILEDILKPILPYLNAFVITLTNITKAIAQMRGAKPQEFGIIESVEQLNEELDETQGKLLSFDKFSVLGQGGAEENALGIDENLLAGLSKYDSILSNITGKAQELAEQWTAWWVDTDTGELTKQAQLLLGVLEAIGITLGTLISYKLITKISSLIGKITGLTTASKLLNATLVAGVVYSIIRAIDAFKEGDVVGGILASTIGITLVGAFLKFNKTALISTITSLKTFATTILTTVSTAIGKTFIALLVNATFATGSLKLAVTSLSLGFGSLAGTLAGAIALFSNWDILNDWQKIVGIIGVLTTAIFGLALAFGAFHSAWSIGLATAGIVAGVVATSVAIGTAKSEASKSVSIPAHKTGGLVEDGLFQMSRGELIGEFDDGTTVVANNQQIIEGIKQGVYTAVRSAMGSGASGDIVLKVDSKEIARATVGATANALSKNYRVDFQPR